MQRILLLCNRSQSPQLFLVMLFDQNISACARDEPAKQSHVLLPLRQCPRSASLACQHNLDRLSCRFIVLFHIHRAAVDDFESLLQFASKRCLHLNLRIRSLSRVFVLMIFHEVIRHRFSNGSAMLTFHALVLRFHLDFTDNCFQHFRVLFSSSK